MVWASAMRRRPLSKGAGPTNDRARLDRVKRFEEQESVKARTMPSFHSLIFTPLRHDQAGRDLCIAWFARRDCATLIRPAMFDVGGSGSSRELGSTHVFPNRRTRHLVFVTTFAPEATLRRLKRPHE